MILDFIGIIVATLVIIIQEFIKDRIKSKWVKSTLFLLILVSFIFSGIRIYQANQTKIKSDNKNLKLTKRIDSLKILNGEIKAQNDTLIAKVNVINNNLKPFILIAKEKYPNLTDREALDKLKSDIEKVKKSLDETKMSIKDAKISKIDHRYIKYGKGIQAELKFHLTNKNIRDKIIFEFYLPIKSQVRINNVELQGSSMNEEEGISKDKKSAYITFNVIGSKIPNIDLSLSGYSQILVRSNYLEKNIVIK